MVSQLNATNYSRLMLKQQLFDRKTRLTEFKLFSWLKVSKNKKFIRYRFLVFIFSVIDKNSGSNLYLEQLKNVYFHKKTSFYISFEHLVMSDPLLSIWITDEPEIILKIFNETCEEILTTIFQRPCEEFNVSIRISGLPSCESMRGLKKKKTNCLVKIRGSVISKTQIFPTIGFFRLNCLKCLETQNILFSTIDQKNKKIKSCFNCNSLGPFQTKWDKMVAKKFQKISVREELKKNSLRWLPYSIEIILTEDLIDCVEYGDKIEVTGILKHSLTSGSNLNKKHPTFFSLIDGNCIQKIDNSKIYSTISSQEAHLFEKIISEQKLLISLIHSFIPNLFQNHFLKLSIILTFCSSGKDSSIENKKNRDSINMLILGEPCTGKSTVLKSIFDFFPDSNFFTGYGSSIKGLTSSLKHDKIVGEWIPEGGLLTMVRGGLCLIDSLEGMETETINSLCKILDQQYISLNQESFLKNLPVKSSNIITFNNFNASRNPSLPFFLNCGLEESLVSKFDIIFNLKPIKNFEDEVAFAKFLLNRFQNVSTSNEKVKNQDIYFKKEKKKPLCLSENFIKRYLNYCRNNFPPNYGILDQSFVLKFYLDLKKETRALNSINFSSNFLEAIIRIVSSSAKLHLRKHVSEKDLAIGLVIFFNSWSQIQPYITKKFLKSKYKNFFSNIFKKYSECFDFLGTNLVY